jgi:hypothetical protein
LLGRHLCDRVIEPHEKAFLESGIGKEIDALRRGCEERRLAARTQVRSGMIRKRQHARTIAGPAHSPRGLRDLHVPAMHTIEEPDRQHERPIVLPEQLVVNFH